MANEIENVIRGHYKRVVAQLTSQTLVFPGSEVPTRAISNYFNIGYPDKTPQPSRLALRLEEWNFLIDCVANTGTDGEDAYKVTEMSDLVGAAFDQVTYAVQDWVGDDSVIGYIRCSEVETLWIPTGSSEQSKVACRWTGFLAF